MDCFQGVADLDKMWLFAMTEFAMDFESFKNTLYLFLLTHLGQSTDHSAIEQ